MVRFVHASDLHLDTPLGGLMDAEEDLARFFHSATFQAWDNIVDLCLERAVDFLLLAGDMYDGEDRSLKAQLAFRDGLMRLAEEGIPAFVVHGNHDPLDSWASTISWPELAHFFGAKVESVPYMKDGKQQAIIHGVSFPQRDVKTNLANLFECTEASVPQIGLLHCNVGTDTGHEPYAPCSLQDLEAAGMDYWALGHVHSASVLESSSPMVVYPGNSQGLHRNETGPRGCYAVSLEEGGPAEAEFVPTDAVRWERASVDIGELMSEEDLLSKISTCIDEVQRRAEDRPSIMSLSFEGRGPLHDELRYPAYSEDVITEARQYGLTLSPVVWVDRLEDDTRPEVDLEARRQAEDVLGDLLRLADEYRNDPERLEELRESLDDLYGHRRAGRFLDEPDRAELLEVLEQAESLCVDRLLEGEE